MKSPRIDLTWLVFSVIASISIFVGALLPLWRLELIAPQYPQGLFIVAHGYSMSGDIKEINALNHYVGLTPLDPEQIVELKLFPIGVLVVIVAILFGSIFFKGRNRIYSALAAGAIPVVMLADLQYQLYVFGHEINSDAPLDLTEFTPHVLGDTQVMNFHSVARPSAGFWMFIFAFFLVSAGPMCWRWLVRAWNNTGKNEAAHVGVALILVLGLFAVLPGSNADAKMAPRLTTGEIAEAISNAEIGETIVIGPGIYEGTLTISKSVVLVGQGTPIIDGMRLGDVITIDADDVTINGFEIRGSSRDVTAESAGIRVKGERAKIHANKLIDVFYGIVVIESGRHEITNNTIQSVIEMSPERRGHAVYFHYSNNSLVADNTLTDAKDGVYLQFSDFNQILHNTISRVRYGTHLMFSNNTTIVNNTILRNVSGGVVMFSGGVSFTNNEIGFNESPATGYGLMFKEVDDIVVNRNQIHHNSVALAMEGAPFTPSATVEVQDNLIGYNKTAVGLFTTTNVLFTGNTFVGNRDHVNAVAGSIEFKNRWSKDNRGNYWDDYHGYDTDYDGVGDITYAYRGVFDSLAENTPILHAYDFTLARIALDMAANWFPIYRPEPRVIDKFPLMRRTMSLTRIEPRTSRIIDLCVLITLVVIPFVMFFAVSRSASRRWDKC